MTVLEQILQTVEARIETAKSHLSESQAIVQKQLQRGFDPTPDARSALHRATGRLDEIATMAYLIKSYIKEEELRLANTKKEPSFPDLDTSTVAAEGERGEWVFRKSTVSLPDLGITGVKFAPNPNVRSSGDETFFYNLSTNKIAGLAVEEKKSADVQPSPDVQSSKDLPPTYHRKPPQAEIKGGFDAIIESLDDDTDLLRSVENRVIPAFTHKRTRKIGRAHV